MIRSLHLVLYVTVISLLWSSASLAQYDDFADRIDLGSVFRTSVTGSNVGFTAEVDEPEQSGVIINSAWWQWTAPFNMEANINTFGSDFDTFLTLATGTAVDELTVLDQNDDGRLGSLQSQIAFDVLGGTTYQIAVDGWRAATGNIRLNINTVPEPSSLSTYLSESSFLAAASIVSTTDFDNYSDGVSLGVGSATVDGIVYEGDQPTHRWEILDTVLSNSRPNVFGDPTAAPSSVTHSFGDGQLAEAIGFYMVHGLVSPVPTWNVTAKDAAGETSVVHASFGSPTFLGFTSSAGIVSVEIADDASDPRITNFFIDGVSRSEIVPEPSTSLLTTFGFLGLLGLRCRRD